MSKILFVFVMVLGLVSCSNQPQATPDDLQLVDQYLQEASSIEDVEKPLESFVRGAGESAVEQMNLYKDNVTAFLEKGKRFSRTVIVVEDHTIVTVTNFDDCEYSKGWDACMPAGSGYIKKSGKLVDQADYINKIIGLPDSKQRTVYFFQEE